MAWVEQRSISIEINAHYYFPHYHHDPHQYLFYNTGCGTEAQAEMTFAPVPNLSFLTDKRLRGWGQGSDSELTENQIQLLRSQNQPPQAQQVFDGLTTLFNG